MGDCEAFGCCPGCSTNDNCVYPSPVCQGDHKCGCDSDEDCQAGDQCNTEDNTCQPIPNECETDADCNVGDVSGVCTAAVAEQTQCFYCDASGLYNVCKPGCLHDADSTFPGVQYLNPSVTRRLTSATTTLEPPCSTRSCSPAPGVRGAARRVST